MSQYILLDIKLKSLKSFLSFNDRQCSFGIEDVEKKYSLGKYETLDDYENEFFHYVMHQELAARTIYYEITALVEAELHRIAYPLWIKSEKYSGSKTIADLKNSANSNLKSLKIISDLKINEVIKLIEKNYDIKILDLEGAHLLDEIREIVNAFKHRSGLVDFRKRTNDSASVKLIEHYRADIEKAFQAIEATYIFFNTLWSVTEKSHHH